MNRQGTVLTCMKSCARTSYLTVIALQALAMVLHELYKFVASSRQLSRSQQQSQSLKQG